MSNFYRVILIYNVICNEMRIFIQFEHILDLYLKKSKFNIFISCLLIFPTTNYFIWWYFYWAYIDLLTNAVLWTFLISTKMLSPLLIVNLYFLYIFGAWLLYLVQVLLRIQEILLFMQICNINIWKLFLNFLIFGLCYISWFDKVS